MSPEERQARNDESGWREQQRHYSPISAAEEISCAKGLEREKKAAPPTPTTLPVLSDDEQ